MENELQVLYIMKQVEAAEAELQEAFDLKKSFYEIKEIVQRIKLLLNELAELGAYHPETNIKNNRHR